MFSGKRGRVFSLNLNFLSGIFRDGVMSRFWLERHKDLTCIGQQSCVLKPSGNNLSIKASNNNLKLLIQRA
jgi:hypothetical protein